MLYGNAELSSVRDLIPAEGGHFLSRGRALLTSGVGVSFDTVHPSAQGMEEIATRLSACILETIL